MKEIPLTQGKIAIVDDDDYEKLKNFKYSLNNCGYARRYDKLSYKLSKKRTDVLMSHDILGKPPKGISIDHADRNRLNNCKCNLRFATRSQNNANKSKSSRNFTTSRYLGVSYDRTRKMWRAQIQCINKNMFIGRFKTEGEAALAYNQAAIKYHGEFANLNIL
jgi:hypothetical protein